MKKSFAVLVAVVFMSIFVFPTFAQDALTQIIVAGDSSFPYSIKYPADWQKPEIRGVNTQIANADGSIKSSFSYPMMVGGTAKEALDQYTVNFKNKAEIQELKFEGRDAARLDGPLADRWQILMIIDVGTDKGLVTFEGSQAALTKADSTLMAIAASFHAPPDSGAAAADTAVPSPTPTAAPISQAALGEGATLAIIDGQVGGSTGMGNELYELNIDTKTGKSLQKFGTKSSSTFNQVSWSPDGSRLLYFSIDPPGLVTANADGSNSQTLPLPASIYDWAPDGKSVTVGSGGGGSWSIVNVGADLSDMKPVLTINGVDYLDYIRWSEDGKWLAYVGTPSGNKNNDEELHIIDSTGNNDQVIVPAGKIERYAMWSPDSTQIAYIGDGGAAGTGLTTVTIETKATKVVAADAVAADWSSDGSQFAYATRDGKLFLINADGTQPHEITRPADLQGQIVAIAWQPGTVSSATSGETAASTAASTPTEATATTTSDTGAASSCSVSSANGANLRGGPGTSFARAGALAGGTSQTVTGQAKGSDNFVWWKLESGSWVRSDVVQTAGDCSTVPTVTP